MNTKTFSDLRDINPIVDIKLTVSPINGNGNPFCEIFFNDDQLSSWKIKSLNRLKLRDVESKIDIGIVDFIEASPANIRHFYIFNHPKKRIFIHVLKKIKYQKVPN